MERKNKIGISFDVSYFSQIFIHTSGAYLSKPISKNNNKNVSVINNFFIYQISYQIYYELPYDTISSIPNK